METTIVLTCYACGKQVVRRMAEHKRTLERNAHVFCGHSCSATWGNEQGLTNPTGNAANLVSDNQRDEYTPFRYFQRVAKRRKHKYKLDLPYLKALWREQSGRCPLTGWQLHLPHSTGGFLQGAMPNNASLDRVNNTLGYIEGNVRFIALIANLARNVWGDEAIRALAHAIVIQETKERLRFPPPPQMGPRWGIQHDNCWDIQQEQRGGQNGNKSTPGIFCLAQQCIWREAFRAGPGGDVCRPLPGCRHHSVGLHMGERDYLEAMDGVDPRDRRY